MTHDQHQGDTDRSKSDLGWQAAAALVRPLGKTASNFAQCISALVAHGEQEQIAGGSRAPLPTPVRQHLDFLLRNATLKAAYYYAAKAYRPAVLTSRTPLSSAALIEGFSPLEHATLLALCYLFRTLSQRCDRDEWEHIQPPLYEELSAGGAVGECLPEVGLACGLLARGMPQLARAAFLLNNRRGFKEYRRHLRGNRLPVDYNFERTLWQCDSVQVAAVLLQAAAHSRTAALQLHAALHHDTKTPPDPVYGTPFRITAAVLEEYRMSGEVLENFPAWVGQQGGLTPDRRSAVAVRLTGKPASEAPIEWLGKSGTSINPSSTPELFAVAVPPQSE
jgi:hypothetical protein